jgi:hypothetical protein
MSTTRNPYDPDFDRLLQAYRSACPDVEPSRDFMPVLWQKIEARRAYSMPFIHRLTQGFAALAAAASLALLLLNVISPQETLGTSISYVEALADAHSSDGASLQDIAYFEVPPEDARR